jgi:hypothetical protein
MFDRFPELHKSQQLHPPPPHTHTHTATYLWDLYMCHNLQEFLHYGLTSRCAIYFPLKNSLFEQNPEGLAR